jgi:hypothetical protein
MQRYKRLFKKPNILVRFFTQLQTRHDMDLATGLPQTAYQMDIL